VNDNNAAIVILIVFCVFQLISKYLDRKDK